MNKVGYLEQNKRVQYLFRDSVHVSDVA